MYGFRDSKCAIGTIPDANKMFMKVTSTNPIPLQHSHYQYFVINSQLMRSVGGVILLIHCPHGLHHCRSGEGYCNRARHLKQAQ
jgi:hypothetical protein